MDRQEKGSYIFLSHCHDDIVPVRRVRNYLEDAGHNPILLYLKGVGSKREIRSIIRREIIARDWFVFCDSAAARKSEWVSYERDLAWRKKKQVWTIDIDSDFDTLVKEKLDYVLYALNVFISYARKDIELLRPIIKVLRESSFNILSDEDIYVGSDWSESIGGMMDTAISSGGVIIFVTDNYLASKFAVQEMMYALSKNGRIFPIVVGKPNIPKDIQRLLKTTQCVHMPDSPQEKDAQVIVKSLRDSLKFNPLD